MKSKPIIIGLSLIFYAIYGYISDEIYIPGRYAGGSFVYGDRVIWIVFCYICIAIVFFLWSIPTRKIEFSHKELLSNSGSIENLVKQQQSKILLSPKYVFTYIFFTLAVLFLFTGILVLN